MSLSTIHLLRTPSHQKSTHQHFLSVKNPHENNKNQTKKLKLSGKNADFHYPPILYGLYTCENVDIYGWPLSKVHDNLISLKFLVLVFIQVAIYRAAVSHSFSPPWHHVARCTESTHDSQEYTMAILMDLSKALDSISHGVLIAKLYTYGVDKATCKLYLSYL